jgi:hypothetical protein
LIDDLLELAGDLAAQGGQARNRRAVSTAYYAAFRALCALVADIGGPDLEADNPDLFESLYRSLDHKVLDDTARFKTVPAAEQIRESLRELRNRRTDADYKPESYRISDRDVLETLELARNLIAQIRGLDALAARRLGLCLMISPRGRPKGFSRSSPSD